MAEWWWLLAAALIVAVLAALVVWSPIQSAVRSARFADARRDFHLQREWLETKFIQLAAAHAKPDTLRWLECEFDNDVSYVRNRSTGELAAFVAMTVASGEAEEHRAEQYHAGTAVFRFSRNRWDTDGAALLNLTPSEAVRFYHDNLEIVAHELAG